MSREQKFDVSTDDLEIRALLWRGNEINYGLVSVGILFIDFFLQHLYSTVGVSVEWSGKIAKLTRLLDYGKYL